MQGNRKQGKVALVLSDRPGRLPEWEVRVITTARGDPFHTFILVAMMFKNRSNSVWNSAYKKDPRS